MNPLDDVIAEYRKMAEDVLQQANELSNLAEESRTKPVPDDESAKVRKKIKVALQGLNKSIEGAEEFVKKLEKADPNKIRAMNEVIEQLHEAETALYEFVEPYSSEDQEVGDSEEQKE